MEITISNIKQGIPLKELKKLKFLAKSLTSDKTSIKTVLFELPKKGVRELRFKFLSADLSSMSKLLLTYLSILQNLPVPEYSGKWYTVKTGNYLVSIVEEGLGKEIDFNGNTV